MSRYRLSAIVVGIIKINIKKHSESFLLVGNENTKCAYNISFGGRLQIQKKTVLHHVLIMQ